MFQIHPNARTTPAVRAEIARSTEPSGELAKRYGVSTETIRKWRKRGAEDCRDRSSRPTHLRWRATDEERAIVCHLRRMTGFALDDLTFTLRHFLPHLNRDSIYRILKAEGLGRLPVPSIPRKVTKQFKEYDLGFVHMDIKHLPKLHVIGSGPRKRYLYVAIDRASRMVHLAVKDEETEACATAFLREAAAAFPFKVTHVLTDRGSCFTADGFEAACRKLGIDHRKTKPYTPQTNGMVERFNGRIGQEVLVMCIGTHDALERLLHGYNLAYNARRQRVLNGQSPDQVVQTRLGEKPELANPAYQIPSPCDRTRTKIAAQLTVYSAKDVSHPDN
ncbi:IS481 family transposase (plasmid) [Skermanella rosea]|uniref:IS481 family transposase n=1 Tax=Skermanella rosea TaxID=1817965 RepID=UPI0019316B62|nr:IS481 family transposase [Skermanella rosea]UEM06912.1 IS481 family transposase [Skermanella rosea]